MNDIIGYTSNGAVRVGSDGFWVGDNPKDNHKPCGRFLSMYHDCPAWNKSWMMSPEEEKKWQAEVEESIRKHQEWTDRALGLI